METSQTKEQFRKILQKRISYYNELEKTLAHDDDYDEFYNYYLDELSFIEDYKPSEENKIFIDELIKDSETSQEKEWWCFVKKWDEQEWNDYKAGISVSFLFDEMIIPFFKFYAYIKETLIIEFPGCEDINEITDIIDDDILCSTDALILDEVLSEVVSNNTNLQDKLIKYTSSLFELNPFNTINIIRVDGKLRFNVLSAIGKLMIKLSIDCSQFIHLQNKAIDEDDDVDSAKCIIKCGKNKTIGLLPIIILIFACSKNNILVKEKELSILRNFIDPKWEPFIKELIRQFEFPLSYDEICEINFDNDEYLYKIWTCFADNKLSDLYNLITVSVGNSGTNVKDGIIMPLDSGNSLFLTESQVHDTKMDINSNVNTTSDEFDDRRRCEIAVEYLVKHHFISESKKVVVNKVFNGEMVKEDFKNPIILGHGLGKKGKEKAKGGTREFALIVQYVLDPSTLSSKKWVYPMANIPECFGFTSISLRENLYKVADLDLEDILKELKRIGESIDRPNNSKKSDKTIAP